MEQQEQSSGETGHTDSQENGAVGVITVSELERSFLKVPVELLDKSFRASHKSVEKELNTLEKAIKDLHKKNLQPEEACQSLDRIVNRLRGVKRKLDDTVADEQHQLVVCKARLDHLREQQQQQQQQQTSLELTASSGPPNHQQQRKEAQPPPELSQWNRVRLNRILVDYLLRSGRFTSATMLANATDIKDFIDIDVFSKSQQIIDELRCGNCKEALAWCSEHRSKLKKLKSSLEFNLRMQEFLELVRKDELHEAISYSRKYLSNAHDTNMGDIKKAMATLAFRKDTTCTPYKELFDKKRWDDLIRQFQHDNHLLHCLTTEPMLYITLQAGLSALKTPQAFDPATFNVNDPLCHEQFQQLADSLPFAYHHRSKLVCRMSGDIMDADNNPMVLPNGHAYGRRALEEMALKNNGIVVDPQTNEQFKFEQLKKVFVM